MGKQYYDDDGPQSTMRADKGLYQIPDVLENGRWRNAAEEPALQNRLAQYDWRGYPPTARLANAFGHPSPSRKPKMGYLAESIVDGAGCRIRTRGLLITKLLKAVGPTHDFNGLRY